MFSVNVRPYLEPKKQPSSRSLPSASCLVSSLYCSPVPLDVSAVSTCVRLPGVRQPPPIGRLSPACDVTADNYNTEYSRTGIYEWGPPRLDCGGRDPTRPEPSNRQQCQAGVCRVTLGHLLPPPTTTPTSLPRQITQWEQWEP